jgi:S-adenosylmethionine:tRNA ribosyltransferase-isomerase
MGGGALVSPATHPRDDVTSERLLVVDARSGSFSDATIAALPSRLRAGDLLVVNDGATLPGSLAGSVHGEPIDGRLDESAARSVEARIVEAREDGSFEVLLFGAGSWRDRTEDRPAPPRVAVGETIRFDGVVARVERVHPASPRLVDLRFDVTGAELWSRLYRAGKPIQYSYLARPLELWDVQTPYASRPWCAEMPSAGRPLAWSLMLEARRRGIRIARLTHAAGISSTGDDALDRLLPMTERYEIPAETVEAIARTRREGGRVIAIGTTVARALEGCAIAHDGELVAGRGTTDLILGPEHRPRIVDALLTGMHEPTESHYKLLLAFAPRPLVEAAHAHATREGYLTHEFGDSSLWFTART